MTMEIPSNTPNASVSSAPSRGALAVLLAAGSLVGMVAPRDLLRADDRDLLRTQTGSAYVMIVLDDSGSMGLGLHGAAAPGEPDCPTVIFDDPVPLNCD